MAKYIIGEGLAEIEVSKGILSKITLLRSLEEPTCLNIPYEVGKQKINQIGDDKKGLGVSCSNVRLYFDNRIPIVRRYAFNYVMAKEIHWPAACKTIPIECFNTCSVKKLTGMENVQEIRLMAFTKTRFLETFEIPKSCTIIDSRAFSGSSIKEFTGGENVTRTGAYLFEGSAIEKFRWFPKNPIIPTGAFFHCHRLINVSGIENVSRIDQVAFSWSGIKYITWPTQCKIVPNACFFTCQSLESITNIDGIELIEDDSFANCTSLKHFYFSSDIKGIGRRAFMNTKLDSVDLSHTTLESLPASAFEIEKMKEFQPNPSCLIINERK